MKEPTNKKRPGRPKGYIDPKKKPNITIRPSLMEEAEQAAKAKRISVSEWVADAISRQLAREELTAMVEPLESPGKSEAAAS